jgi:hypothetical protein
MIEQIFPEKKRRMAGIAAESPNRICFFPAGIIQ